KVIDLLAHSNDNNRAPAQPFCHRRKSKRWLSKFTMLRSLPRKAAILCPSVLAHAVLFRGLHERIPATIGYTHAAENTQDRSLSPVVESRELNGQVPLDS